MIRRGEIYWVEFEPVKGSEQGGLRPALVIQHDTGNRYSPTTVVAAITRTVPPKPYPFTVVIEPQFAAGLGSQPPTFYNGLALVQMTEGYAYINHAGEVIWGPAQ